MARTFNPLVFSPDPIQSESVPDQDPQQGTPLEKTAEAPKNTITEKPQIPHLFRVRIYYEDTDAGGIVYYANYLKFAERARTEMLRALGIEQAHLRSAADALFIVRHVEADYRFPARLDDQLEVQTKIKWMKKASMGLHQRIVRLEETEKETLCVDCKVDLACINSQGRPQRFPAEIQSALVQLA